MKLASVSFTGRGSRLNAAVTELLSRQGYDCAGYAMPRYVEKHGLAALDIPLKEWTGQMFSSVDAILFIGATGIAVRSIAPFLEHKTKDPAVVVMDEKGVFVISLLSGHIGGANELAGTLANLTGAIPVITTATDVNGRFAVDVFAKKNRLYITNMHYAKEISADVLDEKKIGFYSDFPVIGSIPEEIEVWEEQKVFAGTNGICVSLAEDKKPYRQTLNLIPRIISLGVGCKKGTPAEKLEEKVLEALQTCGISMHSIERIASISLKAQEPGLLALADKYHLPLVTYDAEELQRAEGDFSDSAFVRSVTGVDNVCERSAVLASGNGQILLKKTAGDGVTVAAAVRDWSVDFE